MLRHIFILLLLLSFNANAIAAAVMGAHIVPESMHNISEAMHHGDRHHHTPTPSSDTHGTQDHKLCEHGDECGFCLFSSKFGQSSLSFDISIPPPPKLMPDVHYYTLTGIYSSLERPPRPA